jgi:hypothetical protein
VHEPGLVHFQLPFCCRSSSVAASLVPDMNVRMNCLVPKAPRNVTHFSLLGLYSRFCSGCT